MKKLKIKKTNPTFIILVLKVVSFGHNQYEHNLNLPKNMFPEHQLIRDWKKESGYSW